MKVRIITGLVSAMIVAAAVVFIQYQLLALLCIPFCALAAYEICHVAQVKNKAMIAAATAVAGIVPVAVEFRLLARLGLPAYAVLLLWFFLLVALMLARFEETKFSHVLYALLASLAAPGAISTLLLVRSHFRLPNGAFTEQNLARYFFFFACCCAWLTDTFAYFVGVNLGKHKLCPKISPKKTVEGAAGGILLAALTNVGFAAMFNAFFLEHYRINLLAIGLLSVPACVISMLGDLTASTLKRNYGAKDFGKLFPGHGGVMDRFDSLVFVVPFVYAVMLFEQAQGFELLYGALR